MEGEADSASVRADADVIVEKVIARLGVLDRAFAALWHGLDQDIKPVEAAVFFDHEFKPIILS